VTTRSRTDTCSRDDTTFSVISNWDEFRWVETFSRRVWLKICSFMTFFIISFIIFIKSTWLEDSMIDLTERSRSRATADSWINSSDSIILDVVMNLTKYQCWCTFSSNKIFVEDLIRFLIKWLHDKLDTMIQECVHTNEWFDWLIKTYWLKIIRKAWKITCEMRSLNDEIFRSNDTRIFVSSNFVAYSFRWFIKRILMLFIVSSSQLVTRNVVTVNYVDA
jgi:hypothetical protein